MPLSPADINQIRTIFAQELAQNQIKISALPLAGAVSRNAVFPIVDEGSTQKLPLSALLARGFDTVPVGQDLRAMDVAEVADGSMFYTTGVLTPNDGGEGFWFYDANSVAVDNIGTVIAPDSGIGRFLRQFSGAVNAKWFAATGDGSTDDLAAIQAALNYAAPTSTPVYLPDGTYIITDSLVAPVIEGETTIRTLNLIGDGGAFQWAGAGTRIKVQPSLGTFPKGMLVLGPGSRFVNVQGIRFLGISSADTGSSCIHYNNANQGAKFIDCGFQDIYFGIKVGSLGGMGVANDDFCKYNYCEWMNCSYAFGVYGTEAYHHKVTRAMMINVQFVGRFFKDADQTTMNSLSVKDSFIDVRDTAYHVEGNPRAIVESIGNLYEVPGGVADQPKLYVQNEGSGFFNGSAVFARDLYNWSGYGTTNRAFIDVYGWGNVSLDDCQVNVYRPIIYSKCADANVRPVVIKNTKWSNRPAYFQDSTRTSGGQVLVIGGSHSYGQALTVNDATGVTNLGSRSNVGLNLGYRKLAWDDSVAQEEVGQGSFLLGAAPGTAGNPAWSVVMGDGTIATISTTCDTTNGSPIITVASADGLYLGAGIFIGGGVGAKVIKDIDGTTVTLTTNSSVTTSGSSLVNNGILKAGLYLSETGEPAFAAGKSSIAIDTSAATGEPILWINTAQGTNWVVAGVNNMRQSAAVADLGGGATLGDVIATVNELLLRRRQSNQQVT